MGGAPAPHPCTYAYGRSSWTTVVRRSPPNPPQLDQKISDSSAPIAPTMSRIHPIVWTLKPDVDTCTANASTAPTAIRIRLTPIPMIRLLQLPVRHGNGEVAQTVTG